MNYKEYNDYELIYQINDGDELAYNIMCSKYSSLIGKMAKNYYEKNKNVGIDYDDLYQEGLLALSNSLKDYDSSSSLFYTFFILCCKREMERLIKSSRRHKHMILNDSISLNESVKNVEDIFIEDIISNDFDMEDYYISEDRCNKLYDFKYNLNNIEREIYELKLNNFSIKEISSLLDISYKKVDNSLQKIKKVLEEYILNF